MALAAVAVSLCGKTITEATAPPVTNAMAVAVAVTVVKAATMAKLNLDQLTSKISSCSDSMCTSSF